jgi:hypothetical protein
MFSLTKLKKFPELPYTCSQWVSSPRVMMIKANILEVASKHCQFLVVARVSGNGTDNDRVQSGLGKVYF